MGTKFRRWMGLALSAGLTLAGCSDDGPRDGAMTMYLTDAPSDSITAAVVTVEQIYLQGADSTDEGGRVVLLDSAFTVDLRDLANTTRQLFADVIVPGGGYAQLRFVISGGYIEVTANGASEIFASSPDYPGLPPGATADGELQMPSYAESGLKVTVPGAVLQFDGDHRIVLVDFDVAQSFGHGAGPDAWVLHPVIKGTEIQSTGSVHGTVALGTGVTLPPGVLTLADFQVRLGDEVHPLVDAGGTVQYDFQFVLPGSYQLSIEGPFAVTTIPATPLTVVVGGGASVTQDLVITAFQ